MGSLILEENTIQTIKLGHCDEFKEWFEESARREPKFNINKVVDIREGKESNLKSTLVRKKSTALNYAAYYGSLKIVTFLLENGADPTVTNEVKGTALHCAVCYDGEEQIIVDIVERLLEKMPRVVEIDAQTDGQWTALLSSVLMDRPRAAQILLAQGADPAPFEIEPTKLRHSLALAACNDGKVLEVLLKRDEMRKKEQLDKQVGDAKYTALHYAMLYVNAECVRLLVKCGASITIPDKWGNCPIHFATEARNSEEFEKIALFLKDSINKQDHDDSTLLHMLVKANLVQYVKILRKADINAKYDVRDRQGRIPLHYLSGHRGNEELVHILADRYIIKTVDYDGYNALHFAAKEMDHKLIHVLLRAQARELREYRVLHGLWTHQKITYITHAQYLSQLTGSGISAR